MRPDEFDPDEFREDVLCGSLVLTGLQAMLDPPRSAVAACHTVGIAVKMITGDHAATATAIAGQVGMLDDKGGEGAVLTGADLARLPAEDFPDAVDRASVFARVSPEQKLRLVEALQGRGHVVAMTGDGVNDAPALRQAGIGVAMGASGTEVAKDASDMVLTDDDFATIEAAVEEGRCVFDNLTKFITWTLPTNIGEGLVILVAIVFGAALPILPTQILWINMTTAVALGLMLAFEPKEAGIMTRSPRDPGQALLTRTLMVRILLVSSLLVAGSWWLFEWELTRGASLAEARTAALNQFVVVEAFYLFSCRSLTHSAWRIGAFSNRWIIVGVAAQAIGQIAITYLAAMNTVFGTAPYRLVRVATHPGHRRRGQPRGGRRQATAATAHMTTGSSCSLCALPDSERLLSYIGADSSGEGTMEALLTLSNGYLATRGRGREAIADGTRYPASYVARVYNRLVSRVHRRARCDESLVNLPNWLPITVRADDDGPWFTPGVSRIVHHHVILTCVVGCTSARAFTSVRWPPPPTSWNAATPAWKPEATPSVCAPSPPDTLTRLDFDLGHRGHLRRFHLTHNVLDIHARPGAAAPITIIVDDQTQTLQSGARPLRAADRAPRRRPRMFGTDMCGRDGSVRRMAKHRRVGLWSTGSASRRAWRAECCAARRPPQRTGHRPARQ